MRKWLFLALLFALPARAQIVQSSHNGQLIGFPVASLAAPPTATHILLAFAQADTPNTAQPTDSAGNVWVNLINDSTGSGGVGTYRVDYAVANGAGGAYSINWNCGATFFTHAVGFIVETNLTSVPTITTSHGSSTGLTVTFHSTPFGLTRFQVNPSTWQASLVRLTGAPNFYMGFIATPAGSGWNGGLRADLPGTTDYIIDAWSGIFNVACGDCTGRLRPRVQVY